MARRGRIGREAMKLWLIVTLAFLYLPIAVVVVYSFHANETTVSQWTGFTLEWYWRAFEGTGALEAMGASLRIALLNAVFAMILGTLAAVGLRFAPRWLRVSFDTLAYLTLVTPVLVLGIASLVAFVIAGIPRGSATILAIHIVFNSSIVLLIVRARLVGMSPSEEEAAMDLGAGRFSTFVQVTVPRLVPAILAGGLLAFTYSWDDYVVASFVSGAQTTTLPMHIFGQLRFGVSPEVNVLAVVTLLVTLVGLAIVLLILRKILGRSGLAELTPIDMAKDES